MKGLPDSAVVGTYKRVKRVAKPRKNNRIKGSHDFKKEGEFLYDLIMASTKFLRK